MTEAEALKSYRRLCELHEEERAEHKKKLREARAKIMPPISTEQILAKMVVGYLTSEMEIGPGTKEKTKELMEFYLMGYKHAVYSFALMLLGEESVEPSFYAREIQEKAWLERMREKEKTEVSE